jgi:hypothetical protein
MELKIKTKEYEYGDDVGLFYYKDKLVYTANTIDSIKENGYDEPIEEFSFKSDDEFKDMLTLYNKLLDCWNENTQTYKYKDYELRILDI